ncbi:hypothetical protein GF337_00615 [candidate division KSB1 bacterium]|nr:hypothetical protein [candidate division KSB1 bacterium]
MDKIIERSGCLTMFLITMIIGNSIVALLYLAAMENSSEPYWLFPALTALFFLNTTFAIAIALWFKWGIFAFILSNLIILLLSVSFVVRIVTPTLAVIEIIMLFGAVHWGDEQKSWLKFH